MNDQPPLPEDEPKPFDPVWKPKRESEIVGSIWTNGLIGFVAAIFTGMVTAGLTFDMPRTFVTTVWVTAVIGLLVVTGIVSLKTRRTGLVGGVLLAMGLCLLCPVVGVLVICGGGMRLK